jgi:quinol monooxygenase YgiN
MTIGVIATLKIQEGKNAAFEEAFQALAEQVRANEPDNIFYILHRSRTDPQEYKVLEQYNKEADLETHRQSAHMTEANEVLIPLVAAAPVVEVLDTV